MLKVGVTGGIGSGKSIVCNIFELLKIPVFKADKEAGKIMDINEIVRKKLTMLAGDDLYNSEGHLDKKKLAAIIFTDKQKMVEINSIVHPLVFEEYFEWLKYRQHEKYTIMEAAIIFEGGYDRMFDRIITVYAPEELRISRTMKRGNIERSAVIERINNQLNDEMKVQKSDYVIYNDNNQLVIPQILKIHYQLSEL